MKVVAGQIVEVAASLRFATVAITMATKAGATDEAHDQGEEVPA